MNRFLKLPVVMATEGTRYPAGTQTHIAILPSQVIAITPGYELDTAHLYMAGNPTAIHVCHSVEGVVTLIESYYKQVTTP